MCESHSLFVFVHVYVFLFPNNINISNLGEGRRKKSRI